MDGYQVVQGLLACQFNKRSGEVNAESSTHNHEMKGIK